MSLTYAWSGRDGAGHLVSGGGVLDVATGVVPPLLGVDYSTAASPEPNYNEDKWPVLRCYSESNANGAWTNATVKPKAICLTDDQKYPASNPTAMANGLRAFMTAWNSNPTRAQTVVYWAWRNEIFNEYTGAIPASVVTGFQLMRQVADEFPNLWTGVDATTYTITSSDAATRWAVIAPHLQFGACSLYPPGRTKTPVEFTAYAQYIAPVLDMFQAWGIPEFQMWETGSPIDHANPTTGAANYQGTTDWAKRPAYFRDQLQYIYDGCNVRGMWFSVGLYWNRQTTGSPVGPPNQWKHDRTKAPADVATMWTSWTPSP